MDCCSNQINGRRQSDSNQVTQTGPPFSFHFRLGPNNNNNRWKQEQIMVLVSHEDLMTNQDCTSWELNGGHHVEDDPSKSICQRLWRILNSKTVNCIIILVTVLEALIILAELLIDLRIIQDPYSPVLCNNSSSRVDSSEQPVILLSSHNLQITKEVLAYTSVALLALFLFEILSRILTGKGKYLKQTLELCDGVVVVLAFSLDLAFLVTSKDNPDGKVAAVFIILLRLWRIKRLIQSIVHDAKREMGHIINAYKRDKIQAEHKVELLILKVEDLEHEVAYLKEKLKKTEKEAATQKKRKGRDFILDGDTLGMEDIRHSFSNSSPHDTTPWKSVPVLSFAPLASPSTTPHRAISSLSPTSPCHISRSQGFHCPLATSPSSKVKSPRRRRSQDSAPELQEFVKSTVDRILKSASMELDTISEEGVKEKRSLRVEQHDSGRGSSFITPGSTPKAASLQRDHHDKPSAADTDRTSSENQQEQSDTYCVPTTKLFDEGSGSKSAGDGDVSGGGAVHETGQQSELDELSEIERVKRVEFNSIEDSMDIPVTAL